MLQIFKPASGERCDLVPVLAHRWTLCNECWPEHFNRRVEFNHRAKTIDVDIYDIWCKDDEMGLQKLEEALQNGDSLPPLRFTTYDSAGIPLYVRTYYGVKVLTERMQFDYADESVSVRKFQLSFAKYKTHFMAAPVQAPAEPKSAL